MKIPTEPIGSIPRPLELIHAIAEAGDYADPKLDPLYEKAIACLPTRNSQFSGSCRSV
jgi:5-methyltetrahydropteroyltriglutamate--homocysteine methyltransferase